jgi:hypothetical protein
MVQPVSDLASNAEENIAHAAKVIGRSAHRCRVFDAIYTGKKRAKTVSELTEKTGLPRQRVLDAGKMLSVNHLVQQTKLKGETAYEKIGFFQSNKKKILGLASSPAKLSAYPTKRNPGGASTVVRIQLSTRGAQHKQITIDDLGSFSRVKRVRNDQPEIGDELSESQFKSGLQKIIGEGGRFKDWGGEIADLFTTRLRIGGKRRPTAIALKGPGTKGKLMPGKMGKNGDQIQRLFGAPADVFLVQYCRQVDPAVLDQMKMLAIAKSLMTSSRVYYGVIDGNDSRRLVRAYPQCFSKRRA